MTIDRREFIKMLGLASAAGMFPGATLSAGRSPANDMYDIPKFGNVSLLHMTDSHAQLKPVYFREPNVNLGVAGMKGRPPHLVGEELIKHFGIEDERLKHAFTHLNFVDLAEQFGKTGGYAHIRTLINRLRAERGEENTLLLDGGDTWQGSATALWTRGEDMIGAQNLLGVDVMTGHWEFTYTEDEIRENIEKLNAEFVAQNPRVSIDAIFEGVEAYDEDTQHAFKPYTMKEVGGKRVAVIGQAFPYVPIAHPTRDIPNWSFGIREDDMQALVEKVREQEKPDVVTVLSHNGMDVDLKMARNVSGIDVILGGHTHDAVPHPTEVKNNGGVTLVTNGGSNGQFVGVLDLDVGDRGIKDWQYRLVPVFANELEPDSEMEAYIEEVRAPYKDKLEEEVAVADELLYRRGNFNGTFDQVICEALLEVNDAEIALSPGVRWGTTVLPGDPITYENIMDKLALTYPETYVQEMDGEMIKLTLEDVADNLFNEDPYKQQGGDMVRAGGLTYDFDPRESMGNRISNLRFLDGTEIKPDKQYKVTGWATVGDEPSPGPDVWEPVLEYLRSEKTVKPKHMSQPKLKGMKDNPGLADYRGEAT